jgi:hypothetical protein
VELHLFPHMLEWEYGKMYRCIGEVKVWAQTGQLSADVPMGDHSAFRVASSSTRVVQVNHIVWCGLSEILWISFTLTYDVIPSQCV